MIERTAARAQGYHSACEDSRASSSGDGLKDWPDESPRRPEPPAPRDDDAPLLAGIVESIRNDRPRWTSAPCFHFAYRTAPRA